MLVGRRLVLLLVLMESICSVIGRDPRTIDADDHPPASRSANRGHTGNDPAQPSPPAQPANRTSDARSAAHPLLDALLSSRRLHRMVRSQKLGHLANLANGSVSHPFAPFPTRRFLPICHTPFFASITPPPHPPLPPPPPQNAPRPHWPRGASRIHPLDGRAAQRASGELGVCVWRLADAL